MSWVTSHWCPKCLKYFRSSQIKLESIEASTSFVVLSIDLVIKIKKRKRGTSSILPSSIQQRVRSKRAATVYEPDENKPIEENSDLPVQAWKIQEQGLPFAELKIPKAYNFVGKKPAGQFGCSRCGKSYMRKDSLQRHVHWECGKEPQFQCPFCPQRCKRREHWLRHIRRQHFDKIGDMEAYLLAYTPKLEID
ncbi:Longitudinals lacking protein, isoforms A/B/D/L [Anthophora retusa]